MIRIGTSGWSYDHWFSDFYPKSLPKKKAFEYYQSRFDTVELNVSFYRLVPEKTYEAWHQKVKPDFLFAVKGSRYITHIKRLKDFEASLDRFFQTINGLAGNLGPVLFQLPANYHKNTVVLKIFIEGLPKHKRYAFEFRHKSWFEADTYSLLRENNIALAISHSPRFPYSEELTADFVYLRLHGPGALYAGNYSDGELKEFASKISGWAAGGHDVFAYFNNDAHAYAPKNALKLLELI